jgi:hypothetical protein
MAQRSEYMQRLNDPNANLDGYSGYPDIAKSLLMINNTIAQIDQAQISELNQSIKVISERLLRRDLRSPDPLAQVLMGMKPDHPTPLHSIFSAFTMP